MANYLYSFTFFGSFCKRKIGFAVVLAVVFTSFPASISAQEQKLPFEVPRDLSILPKTALIETTQGPIEIEFFIQDAPVTVSNFIYLVRKNFYENLGFHRHVPGFVIQGGDPLGNGKGGPGYSLPPEISGRKHRKGTIGMARLPGEVNPERHSNGSQFYITLMRAPHLDGLYTVFAEVISGMENAEKLRPGDKIIRIRLVRLP